MVIAIVSQTPAFATEIKDAENLLRIGKYDDCIRMTAAAIAGETNNDAWWVIKIKAEVARGKFDDAVRTISEAVTRNPSNLSVQLLAYDVYVKSGREKDAKATLAVIDELARKKNRLNSMPEERVALGRHLLARGTDAREVLDQYYSSTTKQYPDHVDSYLATAELALAKHDRALAAETLQKAPKSAGLDPHFHYLMARAFADDDWSRAAKSLADAVAINPHHVDSLLLLADRRIDAEDFAAAETVLKQVLAIDADESHAWAYRAVIAHLRSDRTGEDAAREAALKRWPMNPEVDHLIGRKLSQDYRFAEGAAYQRRSREKDNNYQPAKAQLCQDLLRLGEEEEGWKLAAEVFAADGYNVVAHNLVTLRDELTKYRTIAGEGFLLRMEAKEADLYGQRALSLLSRARKTLGEKYGVKLDKAVTVEIFPRKQDFAVRTFGLPGADGFLGVCFGPVITANSPASQGKDPSNWEAVLWHEYCHTVTLHKTRNKMPRWLSEGISVYEETRENPGWGRWLTPQYREMILGDDFTPMSQLSSAFMSPKSAMHVQFAYFESAWAVEFLIQRHGFDMLKSLLDDLGAGVTINEALERRTGWPLAKLDREFTEFSRARAKSTAGELTWEKPELPEKADAAAIRAWLEKHPKSFWGKLRLAEQLVKDERWSDAESLARELQKAYPEYVGAGNTYELLADVYRRTAKPIQETVERGSLAHRDGDAVTAHERLIELNEKVSDWAGVAKSARCWLAVNPLMPAPHRALAKAAERLNQREEAITAYRALLSFGVPDSADVHFRLAVLHDQSGERDKARREVLKSLEEAPRSRASLDFLLKLTDSNRSPEKKP